MKENQLIVLSLEIKLSNIVWKLMKNMYISYKNYVEIKMHVRVLLRCVIYKVFFSSTNNLHVL